MREFARRTRSSMLSRGQKFNFLIAKDRGHRDRARTSVIERERVRGPRSAIHDCPRCIHLMRTPFEALINFVVKVDWAKIIHKTIGFAGDQVICFRQ